MWYKKYENKLGVRRKSFKKIISLIEERNPRTLVETGTTRKVGNWAGDGCYTIIFAEYCKISDSQLWTCDIMKESLELCKKLTTEYKENIEYVVSDSIEFLKEYDGQIDLLYLDSMTAAKGNNNKAQLHNLNEFKMGENKLHNNSTVIPKPVPICMIFPSLGMSSFGKIFFEII